MLGLLNEPATLVSNDLLRTTRQYWYDAYGAARYPWAQSGSASKSGLALVIHDGFQSLDTFNNFMSEPSFEDVFIDTHNYQVSIITSRHGTGTPISRESAAKLANTRIHRHGSWWANGRWRLPIARLR